MINLGLVRRAWLETRGTTIMFGMCIALIATLLNFAIPKFQKSIEAFQFPASRMMNINNIRNAMLGTDVTAAGGREIAAGVAWSHPFFLALFFAHAITVCTRLPAGEVEKGTMDVLLGLPVSRWEVFISETVVWVASGAVLVGVGLAASRMGNHFAPEGMTPDIGRVGMIAANLLLLYLTVGSVALLCGSIVDRRMRAVAIVLIFVIASLVVNYLRLLWDPAKQIAFLSVLDYYRPIGPLGSGEWPRRDLVILGGATAVLWGAAGVWFSRRDLSTT